MKQKYEIVRKDVSIENTHTIDIQTTTYKKKEGGRVKSPGC